MSLQPDAATAAVARDERAQPGKPSRDASRSASRSASRIASRSASQSASRLAGPPGRPEAVEVGASEILLKWAAPADEGGSAVRGYRVWAQMRGLDGFKELISDTGECVGLHQRLDELSRRMLAVALLAA